jgi:DNA-binding CsgD family transcriptional regulator
VEKPVGSLSESQKGCLRLVAQGMSSKEIAIAVKLTPQTVDTYIKTAMSRLGVSNRREAARLLTDWEASQKTGSPSQTVVETAPAVEERGVVGRGSAVHLISLPPVGGRPNALSNTEKLLAALKVAVVGATAVIALALLIAGVLKTFH